MDYTDPSKGFKTPSRKKNYEASEDANAIKLWHLGPPFLSSRPAGAVRPDFDQATEDKIQLIAKKIIAGLDAKVPNPDSGSEEDASSAQDSKPAPSVPVLSASQKNKNDPVVMAPAPPVSSISTAPSASCLTKAEMKAELAHLSSSMADCMADSVAKLLEGRGDLSMDGDALNHAQVDLMRLA